LSYTSILLSSHNSFSFPCLLTVSLLSPCCIDTCFYFFAENLNGITLIQFQEQYSINAEVLIRTIATVTAVSTSDVTLIYPSATFSSSSISSTSSSLRQQKQQHQQLPEWRFLAGSGSRQTSFLVVTSIPSDASSSSAYRSRIAAPGIIPYIRPYPHPPQVRERFERRLETETQAHIDSRSEYVFSTAASADAASDSASDSASASASASDSLHVQYGLTITVAEDSQYSSLEHAYSSSSAAISSAVTTGQFTSFLHAYSTELDSKDMSRSEAFDPPSAGQPEYVIPKPPSPSPLPTMVCIYISDQISSPMLKSL